MRSRFSRWDGSQEFDDDPIEDSDLIDEISDDLLAGTSPRRALGRLMRRGISGRMPGLDDLARRIAGARWRWAEQTDVNGAVGEFAARLRSILDQEKAALAEQNSDAARMKQTELDLLPRSTARALSELKNYRFTDPQAQAAFDQLVQDVREEVLQAQFGRMMGSMRNMTPEHLARMRLMIAEINSMVQARERGDTYDFEGFMSRFGDLFPERPGNLDELLEALARRQAAMSRLMASLSPEQRAELEELTQAVLDDADMEFEMAMLTDELRILAPNLPWGEAAEGQPGEPLGLARTADAFERLGELEDLERALKGSYAGAGILDVDEDALRRALDEQSVRDLRQLKRIERALEESGMLARQEGKLALTAKGIRKLAERALVKVFEALAHDRPGGHDDRSTGGPAEPTGATRPWRFEDHGQISVQRTVFNAVTRSAGRLGPVGSGAPGGAGSRVTCSAGRLGPGGVGGSVKIEPEDFELIETESRTRTATALLIDLSFSMPLRGHWVPAKRMALALHALIEAKYPQDELYLIGFSDYARRLDLKDLTAEGGMERVQGTNMQHAFLLARRLLAGRPWATRQVIMVTDGEPTAHLGTGWDGSTESFFQWPTTSETIHKTLAEATRLSSSGVILNIYMLEDDPGLIRFMTQVAQLTGGRVLQAAGQDLGQFVLRDFVKHR